MPNETEGRRPGGRVNGGRVPRSQFRAPAHPPPPDSQHSSARDSISAARPGRDPRHYRHAHESMRLRSLALLLVAAPLVAQSPRQLTPDDYARAERFLGATTAPLVTGTGVRPTWTEDGRFWYRTTVPGGGAFFVVDPARRSREALFDQTRLTAALAAASGGRVDGSRLSVPTFHLAKDSRSMTVRLQNRRRKFDLHPC